ncbi:Bug family tripartite tricarboxylate transporter substrate binding protein [Pseudorhodoferax sp.]|uniref:Bug family tripartite tricarboxylate transporter substrate binding protein n=1 Tax=Pseudorhodoferax sp. TaxID=1993553 RepID=UPI0039E4A0F0
MPPTSRPAGARRTVLRRAAAVSLACAAGALLPAASAFAQNTGAWPSRPVKLIVPYAAGGFADTRARKIAEQLGQRLGQPVVIDNRAGAGGVTGTDAIAKATDGHTFGFGSPAPLVTNPMLMKKMPYDAERDLLPIVLIEEAPLVLSTALNQPFKSVRELVAAGQAKPDTLTYGSSGVGGAHHLSGELLAFQTGTRFVHVPYKGGAPAATDLMGGHLAFMFEMGYAALPAIQSGKVRPLAVSGKQRLKVLPQVPTLDEAGVKGFESYNWLGMIAPAGTPPAVITRLNAAVNEALADPGVRSMIEDSGGVVVGGSPQDYAKFLAAERAKWGPLIRSANITLD